MEKIKKYVNDWCVALCVVCLLGAVAVMVSTNNTLNNASEAFERVTASHVDTTAVEVDWGLGANGGTVRMVCGWKYIQENTIEDQMGEVWEVDCDLSENDFFLLWINDNCTPEDTSDDILVQLWREA